MDHTVVGGVSQAVVLIWKGRRGVVVGRGDREVVWGQRDGISGVSSRIVLRGGRSQ